MATDHSSINTRLSQFPVQAELLDRILVDGTPDERKLARIMLGAWKRTYKQVGMTPLLPLLFNLKGKPYNLKEHFPMEPMFRLHRIPHEILFKCGRQVSKCLDPSALVVTADGRETCVSSLKVGDRVVCYDNDFNPTTAPVSGISWNRGRRRYALYTNLSPSPIIQTAEHRHRTLYGYTAVEDLAVGDCLASPRSWGEFGDLQVEDKRITFTAYMLGDGSCCSGNFNFTSSCLEALAEVEGIAKHYQAWSTTRDKEQTSAKSVALLQSKDLQLRKWLEEDQAFGKHAWEKEIPEWVYSLDKKSAALFLSRLWATDGHVSEEGKKPNITYTSTSEKLARGVWSLLRKFGILSTVQRRPTSYKDAEGRYVACRNAFVVRLVGRESWAAFQREIPHIPGKPHFTIPDTEERSNRLTAPDEAIGLIVRLADRLGSKHDRSLRSVGLRRRPKYCPSRLKLKAYYDHFSAWLEPCQDLHLLRLMVESGIEWARITKIEELDDGDTVDIEVETHHNFVVEGIITHNSTCLAYQGLGLSIIQPYFNTLYVTPLYEQIRRFSHNYMKQAVETCRVRDTIRERGSSENILQRTLSNQSTMFFSFAFTDYERTRGINADAVKFDEVQGIDHTFIPVIQQSTKASDFRLFQYSGTPLTKDNTIEKLWQDSSMAEWCIPCHNCKKLNVCSYDGGIVQMLGKHGLICAKCGKPINTEEGWWEHQEPDKTNLFAGYHAPQPIFPMHCRDHERWAELLREMRNETVFMNEVLGESWDVGSRLVTQTELKAACVLPHKNTMEDALRGYEPNQYVVRMLAIDWSGGGAKEESLTAYVVLGLLPSGKIDVIYATTRPHRIDHAADAMEVIGLYNTFHCHLLAHDYTGAGANRESMMVTMGFDLNKIFPITLASSHGKKHFMTFTPAKQSNVRSSYVLDKARSLVFTCELIKNQYIRWPKYETCKPEISHFLGLVEETRPTPRGPDLYLIGKAQGVPDDVAQATNIGVCAMYESQGKWPDILKFVRGKVKQKNSRKALVQADPNLYR